MQWPIENHDSSSTISPPATRRVAPRGDADRRLCSLLVTLVLHAAHRMGAVDRAQSLRRALCFVPDPDRLDRVSYWAPSLSLVDDLAWSKACGLRFRVGRGNDVGCIDRERVRDGGRRGEERRNLAATEVPAPSSRQKESEGRRRQTRDVAPSLVAPTSLSRMWPISKSRWPSSRATSLAVRQSSGSSRTR